MSLKGAGKSDLTRARILDAAIGLFRRQGFEAATMRGIAAEAGVATGAAYYYFDSKNAIVLAFYDRSRQEMAPLLEEALESSKDLRRRLAGVIEVKLRYFLPYRDVLTALAGRTDPADPLSPFSEQTREIRDADVEVFARALADSRTKISRDLATHLPRLLWLYQMGIILFWIYDRSPEQQRTQKLLDSSLGLVVALIKGSAMPLMAPFRRRVVEIIDSVM
ncbi:MAG TPA: TetR family transcriptional regulator [Bryobacteraceae bacterium]|jgi:AcrR family transcriptional regulator